MVKIVTSTSVQQNMRKIVDTIDEKPYIVTNRGEGKMIILPYFEGCDDWITDYMEDYELKQNLPKLKQKWQDSLDSGESDLAV